MQYELLGFRFVQFTSWKETNYKSVVLSKTLNGTPLQISPIDFSQRKRPNISYMSSIHHLTAKQLLQAADLKEKIVGLEKQLEQLLGTKAAPIAASKPVAKKRVMSAAAKAKISAAAKLRWAKVKAMKSAAKTKAVPAAKKKGGMSAAARAKISAAAKARWAKAKAAGKKSL